MAETLIRMTRPERFPVVNHADCFFDATVFHMFYETARTGSMGFPGDDDC
jgi:hypothetical protein